MQFDWNCHPEAEAWLYALLKEFQEKNSALLTLEEELQEKTSTRLFDWIDHFTVEGGASTEQALSRCGYEQLLAMSSYRVFAHNGAKLPFVLVREGTSKHPLGIALKVESIADFLMVRGEERCIEGSFLSPYRRALFSQENDVAILLVERRSTLEMEPTYMPDSYLDDYLTAYERWQTRNRSDIEGALILAEELAGMLGKDTAAWIVLGVERKFWQARNTAAQIQKNRQDRLGMGWANHDHHTFRSSRTHFTQLVRLFETLGFHARERFYAGEQAGWGAQVMENPRCGLILFLDVDLAPEELEIEFAHHPLPDLQKLGTVGLWCGLHGDSILEAGMHHLEAQFSFDKLKTDLQGLGIGMMDPFSNFPYLKQAFTVGEKWPVKPKRVEALVQEGSITHEEADRFLKEGAIGSHLENLQRDEGYKGFNKDNVSLIIKKTDPRQQLPH